MGSEAEVAADYLVSPAGQPLDASWQSAADTSPGAATTRPKWSQTRRRI